MTVGGAALERKSSVWMGEPVLDCWWRSVWSESLRCELENLSLTVCGSPIHTEDFRSSTAPPTVKDRLSNSHRRLSLQRCSTNCQGQILQFTPKTFVPALLDQLSKTASPIHTEDIRSSAAPPTVKDRLSNSHRRLSFQRCSTNCQGQEQRWSESLRCELDNLSLTVGGAALERKSSV